MLYHNYSVASLVRMVVVAITLMVVQAALIEMELFTRQYVPTVLVVQHFQLLRVFGLL
ncbi:MAG TPA: hypothetical protein VM368_10030 [Flavisolibacter sp.]|nr:hypothetical protein [Flavisolibacter sp.]